MICLDVFGLRANSGGLLPKTLPGSLQAEWRRCGKPGCHCASGTLHGPYWYRRWRESGRQRRQYVPRDQVNAVRVAIEQRRRLRPPAWSLRQALAELRRLTEEVRDVRRDW
jgi:hypothetical protein